MNTVHTYKDLIVWQKSMDLANRVYVLTGMFPKEELYGLTSQIRRAVVSIPSNIAEGRYRGSRKDFTQFLRIARASCAELETQLILSQQVLPITPKEHYDDVYGLLIQVSKMLAVMVKKMSPKAPASQSS